MVARHERGWSTKPLGTKPDGSVKHWKAHKLRYQRVIAWIERFCLVPEGRDVGKPVRLRAWQRWIVRAIYPDSRPIRRVIISVGRKNAKSALAAMLALVHLVGPEHKKNSQLYSTALSKEQAALIYELAAKMVRMSAELKKLVAPKDSIKTLKCRVHGTMYRALSADAKTTMGLSPVFAIHDELGQVEGPTSKLYNAVETGVGAHDNPLSVIISTQAATDGDLLSILIDDAKKKKDPRTRLFIWEAPEDCDLTDIKAIQKANPAFGDFQNSEELLASARDAERMPSLEADYRNLNLNQRVEVSSPFVSKSVWKLSGEAPEPVGACYGGLDLSEVSDLTAFVLTFPEGPKHDIKPFFWLPEDGLKEKSKKDRVPYDVWAKDGFLIPAPGKTIAYEWVARQVKTLIDLYGVRKIGFDRYNMRHFRPWLLQAGMSESQIDDIFVDFGQGYFSMHPALNNLETLLLNEFLRHGNHPVLTMCAANAVVKKDEAGWRKLDKAKSRGRIDGMVALTMAEALAAEEGGKPRVFPVSAEDIAA